VSFFFFGFGFEGFEGVLMTLVNSILLAWVLSNGLLAAVIRLKAVSVYPTLLLRAVAYVTCEFLFSVFFFFPSSVSFDFFCANSFAL
jgi:hypothetical protein